MDEQPDKPKTVTLRNPKDLCLDVVVTEEMAAVLRRFGFMDVDEPADEPLEVIQTREGQADGNSNTVSGMAEGDPGGAGG